MIGPQKGPPGGPRGDLGAQVDFGEVDRMQVAGHERRLWLFAMTLCFSRYSYYELVLDQTMPTFLGAIGQDLAR